MNPLDVSPTTMDPVDPLELLPEEMWLMILSKLEDSKDLINASGTCYLWKWLLKNRRPAWILPKVFPNLFNYLPKEDILNARLVSKLFNKAIEKHLEEGQPELQQVGKKPFLAISPCDSVRSLHVEIPGTVPRGAERPVPVKSVSYFIEQFGVPSEKNIFISRSLSLNVHGPANFPLILKMFQLHGKHIWSLSLCLWQINSITLVQLGKFIWQLLGFAPNLRKLQLYANATAHKLSEYEEIFPLRVFVITNPTPPLVHLKALELNSNIGPLTEIMFAAYAQQLTSCVESWNFQYQEITTFTKLKDLTWVFRYNEGIHEHKVDYFNCPSLTHLNINLLGTSVTLLPGGVTGFHNKLFSLIENYSKTSKCLNIYWTAFLAPVPVNIRLPHLSEICLEFMGGKASALSLAFLEGLRRLKKITLKFDQEFYQQTLAEKQNDKENIQESSCSQGETSTNESKRVRVDINKEEMRGKRVDLLYFLDEFGDENTVGGGGSERPYGSNIWRFIKSLRVIVVEVYWHTDSNISKRSKTYLREVYYAQILAEQKRISESGWYTRYHKLCNM